MRKANKRHSTGRMANENAGVVAFLSYCGKRLAPLGLSVDTLDTEGYSEALGRRLLAVRAEKRSEAEKRAERSAWWFHLYHNKDAETEACPF